MQGYQHFRLIVTNGNNSNNYNNSNVKSYTKKKQIINDKKLTFITIIHFDFLNLYFTSPLSPQVLTNLYYLTIDKGTNISDCQWEYFQYLIRIPYETKKTIIYCYCDTFYLINIITRLPCYEP